MTDEVLSREPTYRVSEGVRWAVETDGLLVMDGRGSVYSLGYPESALWDLLTRGCGTQRAKELLGHIASVPRAEVELLVVGLLEEWVCLGLVRRQ